ncbi:hypothetical protein SNE40_003132 [Patella caerulea]|uniref:PHD-type domain-containing protein n=1 Tax=Patella caerulea TaxID=87958 RepID=A0AAN8KAC2_PATCE
MSQVDLDAIQTKLKVAIKNHQTLVEKLNSDPKNQMMRNKLRELQMEIMNLSERQKHVVQSLRKEIVQKQPQTFPITKLVPGTQQYVSIAPQIQTVPLTSQTPTLLTAGTPVSFVTIPTAHLQKSTTLALPVSAPTCLANDLKTKFQVVDNSLLRHVSANNNNVLNVPVNRGTSPLIRVPQYSISTTTKPSILQSRGGSCLNRQVKIQDNKTQCRPSDCDIKDVKKTAEKKQISSEEKQKLKFMAALDLVTPETLKELQSKRTERKRRSTANPQFSYHFEPEKKHRLAGYMLNNLQPGVKRGRGRPPKHGPSPNNSRPSTPNTPTVQKVFKSDYLPGVNESEETEYLCAVCGRDGQVLLCNSCYKVFHMACLDPPLTAVPTGYWCCSPCQTNGNSLTWNGAESMAVVNSYIATKTVKEDEKRKLQKKSTELISEKSSLEARSKELTENLTEKMKCNKELAETNKQTKQNVDNLNKFIKSFQTA